MTQLVWDRQREGIEITDGNEMAIKPGWAWDREWECEWATANGRDWDWKNHPRSSLLSASFNRSGLHFLGLLLMVRAGGSAPNSRYSSPSSRSPYTPTIGEFYQTQMCLCVWVWVFYVFIFSVTIYAFN